MDTMGHVANAWGQLSWEDHIPYSMDTDTGLPEFSSATKFGSFNFWLTETVRHPSTVFFSFTAPRTQFCYSGCVSWFAVRATPLFLQTMTLNIRSVHREFHRCSYWDTFRCEGNYTLVDGDAFKVCGASSPNFIYGLSRSSHAVCLLGTCCFCSFSCQQHHRAT